MSSIILIAIMILGNTLINKLSGMNYRTHINPEEMQ